MDAAFCVEALKEALAKHGKPEVFNTDQGSQFTSGAWIDVLTDAKIKINMPLSDCMQSPAGNRWERRVARQSHDRKALAIVEV
jgi:transposase InsO family protein